MTTQAIHLLGRDRRVRLLEPLSIGFMTLPTKGLQRKGQQLVNASRVRLMTTLTIPFSWRMTILFRHFGFQLSVAGQTEVGTFRQQQKIEL